MAVRPELQSLTVSTSREPRKRTHSIIVRFREPQPAILLHVTKQTFIVMRVIFSLLIVAGVVVGFSGARANGSDCGSVFVGRSDVGQAIDNLDASLRGEQSYDSGPCEDALSSRSTIVWALILVGGIGNAIAFVMRPSQNEAQIQPPNPTSVRRDLSSELPPDGQTLESGWHPDPHDTNLLAYWNGEEWFGPDNELPAGWYPDPDDKMWLAYWNGEDWVETDEKFPNR